MASRSALRSLLHSHPSSLLPRVHHAARIIPPAPLTAGIQVSARRWRNAYTSDSPQLPPPPSSSGSSSTNVEVGGSKQKIGQVEPRLSLTFTCTAPLPSPSYPPSSSSLAAAGSSYTGGTATTDSAAPLPPPLEIGEAAESGTTEEEPERTCGHRSTHEFSKRSYENGIVLIQCPSCKSRHLIADHLGWFKESMEDGRYKNVEDLLRAKGEKVTRGRVNFDGDVEYDGSS